MMVQNTVAIKIPNLTFASVRLWMYSVYRKIAPSTSRAAPDSRNASVRAANRRRLAVKKSVSKTRMNAQAMRSRVNRPGISRHPGAIHP